MSNKTSQEHQSPTGDYNYTDYSEKMDDLIFTYDKDFYPLDEELPDPQVNPIIPGARVPLNKVGIGPVDLPIKVTRREGGTQILQSTASLYCSLDDPNAKGLNLSRLYLLMHDKIKDHLTIDGIKSTLEEMANKQGSNHAYCKLRFKYPMTQKALRSRMPLTETEIEQDLFQTLSNGEKISLKKLEGHIAYEVELEGQYHRLPTFYTGDEQPNGSLGVTGDFYMNYYTNKLYKKLGNTYIEYVNTDVQPYDFTCLQKPSEYKFYLTIKYI